MCSAQCVAAPFWTEKYLLKLSYNLSEAKLLLGESWENYITLTWRLGPKNSWSSTRILELPKNVCVMFSEKVSLEKKQFSVIPRNYLVKKPAKFYEL